MIGFIFKNIKRLVFLNHYSGVSRYIISGNSHFFTTFRLTIIKAVEHKIYLKVGNDSILDCKIIFESENGEVVIGDKCYIGSSTIICRSKIEFGNNVMVAMGSIFYDHDSHSLNYLDREDDIEQQLDDYRNGRFFIENKSWKNVNYSPIVVNDNAWVGINCIILKGVTIGEGAIVGAGSVVTRDVPPWSIVAGNPAKVIKEIPNEQRKK